MARGPRPRAPLEPLSGVEILAGREEEPTPATPSVSACMIGFPASFNIVSRCFTLKCGFTKQRNIRPRKGFHCFTPSSARNIPSLSLSNWISFTDSNVKTMKVVILYNVTLFL